MNGGSVDVLVAEGLVRTFPRGAELVHALAGVDLALAPGEVVALAGPSGSGKSTLLAVLCGWEEPDAGRLAWGGALAGRRADRFGWAELALVPQALGLLPDLSIADNLLLPARLAGRLDDAAPRAAAALADFGLAHLADRYPHQASLGEQQRAAVARALLLRPAVVLADEPTAHQDRRSADRLLDALVGAARGGSAVLLATHDELAWARADRVVAMRDGRLLAGDRA